MVSSCGPWCLQYITIDVQSGILFLRRCQADIRLFHKRLAFKGTASENMIKVDIDASRIVSGGVLLQKDANGIDWSVCYLSKKYDKPQKKFSTVEKQTLSLNLSLQYFKVYLRTTKYQAFDRQRIKEIGIHKKCYVFIQNIQWNVLWYNNPLAVFHNIREKNQRLMR